MRGIKHTILLHLSIELELQRRQAALDHALHLVGQFRFHVLLQTTQQERAKHLVQTLDDQQLLFFVQADLVRDALVVERRVEPFLKALDTLEDLGQDKVKQRPQFRQVVLCR